jgi:CubicO group peptidase (beta-lactamase class C family)
MRALQSSLFLLLLALLLPAIARAQPAAAPASPPAKLAEADAFFTDPALGQTRALMVVQDGRILYERYAPGFGPANRFISWSMAKSITATLIGELVAEGRLELDLPAPVPAWRQRADDPRAAITLRQLLHMASGLRHVETGPDPEKSDTNRALFADRSGDIVAAATMAPLQHKPGSHFEYSTLTTHILADIITRTVAPEARTAAERRRAVKTFIDTRLAGPAAMPTLLCEFDPRGILLGGSFCHASLRDWAAFGQLYLDNGRVAGREVVRPDWVAFVRTPSPAFPGYGGHFWLNLPVPRGRESALFADQGPPDAYAAIGHLGQYVIIVPSKRLVVVRLGFTPDPERAPLKAGLGRLVNSLPDTPDPSE